MFVRPKVEFREQVSAAHSAFTARERFLDVPPAGDLLAVMGWAAAHTRPALFLGHEAEVFMQEYGKWMPVEWSKVDIATMNKWDSMDRSPREPINSPDGKTEVSHREFIRINMRELYGDRYDDLMHMVFSLHVDSDSPTVVRWREYVPYIKEWRFKSMSVVKFVGMLNRKYGFRIPDDVARKWSEEWAVRYRNPTYDFRWSESPSGTYNEESFNSCMYEHEATMFYNYQPNVRVLEIRDDITGELRGRALVWSNVLHKAYGQNSWEPGYTVMDRIYPSDGGAHIDAAIAYAASNGWVYKTEQCIGGYLSERGVFKVAVDVGENYFPYMDTFSTGGWEGNTYYLSNGVGVDEWNSTTNDCPWDDDDDDEYEDDYDY